jgi:hypothetical protein
MEISQVSSALMSLVNLKASPNMKDSYMKAIPIFCEKLGDSGLMNVPITKEWMHSVRNFAFDATSANAGFLGALVMGFVKGIVQGIRKETGDPNFADFGFSGDLLAKVQMGQLYPAELFEKAPQIAFPVV